MLPVGKLSCNVVRPDRDRLSIDNLDVVVPITAVISIASIFTDISADKIGL